ncbi:MAG: hypothetical protein Q8Q20_05335, partial [bacterium]|nr:hypothetical protein [bacterium]
ERYIMPEESLNPKEEEVFQKLVPPMTIKRPHPLKLLEKGGSPKYKKVEVERDMMAVASHRQRSDMDHSNRGAILEAFMQEAPKLGWFGSEVRSVQSSEFDDRFHGVDSILLVRTGKGLIPLAIDTTIKNHPEGIQRKLGKIQQGIEQGSLTEVRYFSDPKSQIPIRSLRRVPHVVLGVDAKGVTEIAESYHAAEIGPSRKQPGSVETFKNHPLKKEILREITSQLENQVVYTLTHFLEILATKFINPGDLGKYATPVAELAVQLQENILLEKDPKKLSQKFETIVSQTQGIEHAPEDLDVDYPLGRILEKLLSLREHFHALLQKENRPDGQTRTNPTVESLTRPWTGQRESLRRLRRSPDAELAGATR